MGCFKNVLRKISNRLYSQKSTLFLKVKIANFKILSDINFAFISIYYTSKENTFKFLIFKLKILYINND